MDHIKNREKIDLMDTSITPPSDPTGKSIEEAAKIAKEFLGDLIEPALKETGGILGDTVRYWRYKNQINLALKAKSFLESKRVKPLQVPPKTLLPIIENGSLEEETDMRDRWAAMLANAADPKSSIRVKPSYPEILKELSPLEVKILDNFYSSIKDRSSEDRKNIGISSTKVLEVFKLTSDEYEIIADNLFRLNLCQPPTSEGGINIGRYPVALKTYEIIKLTPLGIDFIRACRFETDELRTSKSTSLSGNVSHEDIPEEAIEKYAAHVIQTGGIGSRQFTRLAWLLTEHAYINPPDRFAVVTFNGAGDIMGLSSRKGYKIVSCTSPSGNHILDEPGFPMGCRIGVEDKLKNEILIECEKISTHDQDRSRS